MKRTRAPYRSPLRARLKEQTSTIILEAVATILREAELSAISIAEVARVAQVTEQTVYRHYSSRDALVRAFIKYHLDQATGGPEIKLPDTIAELLAWLERRYRSWENDRQIVSETYLSPAGRKLRQPLYELGYQHIMRLLEREHPRLDADRRRNIAAAMLALMSTENFVFLQRTLGFGPEQVHASVVTAINTMLLAA